MKSTRRNIALVTVLGTRGDNDVVARVKAGKFFL